MADVCVFQRYAAIAIRPAAHTHRGHTCPNLQLAQKLFLIAQEIVIYSILTLRVYAMFNLNRRLLAVLCATGIGTLAVGTVRLPAGLN